MGNFTIKKGSNNQFYFNLKASNNQIILQSEGYKSKSGCENGIQSVKSNCSTESNYHRKVSSNLKHFFVLVAGNNQTIGKSQLYKTKQGMENGITSVKTNAPNAPTTDLS